MAMALAILDWEWKGAERELVRALSLNPSYVTAHHWYAVHLLVAQKRWDEAIREMNEAQKLDPFSAVIATNLGRVLFISGREDQGIRQYQTALQIDPNFAYAHLELGVALVRRSLTSEGTKEIEAAELLSPGYIAAKAGLAFAFVKAGRKTEAREILQKLLASASNEYVPSTWIGGVQAVLGNTDEAFEWLTRAAKEHSSTFPEFYSEPMFDGLSMDSRLGELLKSIGVT